MEIDRGKLKQQHERELKMFEEAHPKSKALHKEASEYLLQGVPLNWMVRWSSAYPITVVEAKGAHLKCVDGLDHIDFCLGDTGSMVGHAVDASVKAISEQVKKGTTFMLPTEDATWVGKELQRRFGLKYWQFTTSATDANRFALRMARAIFRAKGDAKRNKILAYDFCYHGSVDETLGMVTPEGKTTFRKGNIGQCIDPSVMTKFIEWNDVDALEEALKDEDVIAVIAEPVMTNMGIIHPDPGYHEALRALTRKCGTYLLIDETHTICTGIGGYTRAYGLEPDILTAGKTLASGIPVGIWGVSEEFGKLCQPVFDSVYGFAKGIGGTLAANALTMATLRTTLSEILTEEYHERDIALATRFNEGVQSVIREFDLPWNTKQLGLRTEYWFKKEPARNGADAYYHTDLELDWYMHLASLNRGILMTPFHNMALICGSTTEADVDKHTAVFREIVQNIL